MASSRARTALFVAVLLAVGGALAWVGSRRDDSKPPAGSSRSYTNTGAQALFLWTEALGKRAVRLDQPSLPAGATPDLLVVIEPIVPVDAATRALFDEVPRGGGTLVVAASTPLARDYLAALGAQLVPGPIATGLVTADGTVLPLSASWRIRAAPDSTPLLTLNGEPVAIRRPYLNGSLVILSTSEPLSNEGLRDPSTARFVYSELLERLPAAEKTEKTEKTAVAAFDESHRSVAAAARQPVAGLGRYLFATPVGGAIVYSAGLVFLYLLLSGRRLGPALAAVRSEQSRRALYEHVQALAGLYRRGHQLGYARGYFLQHYRRRFARANGASSTEAVQVQEALEAVAAARSDAQLVAAIQLAEIVLEELPGDSRATLSRA